MIFTAYYNIYYNVNHYKRKYITITSTLAIDKHSDLSCDITLNLTDCDLVLLTPCKVFNS